MQISSFCDPGDFLLYCYLESRWYFSNDHKPLIISSSLKLFSFMVLRVAWPQLGGSCLGVSCSCSKKSAQAQYTDPSASAGMAATAGGWQGLSTHRLNASDSALSLLSPYPATAGYP